jgi:hypothetical protein
VLYTIAGLQSELSYGARAEASDCGNECLSVSTYTKRIISVGWMDTCLIQSVLLPTARLTNGETALVES